MSPIRIADAERNSAYWQATEQQTFYMAQFLLAAGKPDRLADLPEPQRNKFLTADPPTLDRGKRVFAERCARCHSSKLPEPVVGMQGAGRGELQRAELSDVLEPLLGVDQDRRIPPEDAGDRAVPEFPRGQLPLQRIPGAGDPAADQRLQPAGAQCAGRQHLG